MSERSIFLAVVEIDDPAARSVYLDRACAGDPVLRTQVEQLLKAHHEPGPFMEGPAHGLVATIDEPIAERPGTVMGPYKLLEQIGEGGFGIVFMAEQQEPIRRKVALKVLKPGMDTRQVIARFEAERQALALMDHPNIAKVLDAGQTANGRPYFVMDLVKGVPITDYCDQSHLTPRERLELFVPVCQAVQHAHQKGIIHRDLKPSNVLVTMHDIAPVVKVIDFGVAKALGQELTDKTLFTGFAQMVGTPLYMSPEQAGQSSLDIDTRSDIYSLGVLLYELLTGTTPFDKERFKKAAYDEIRRIIREEEPPKPSTRLSESKDALSSISAQRQTEPAKLTKLVRGELDWIVMKCLEKDRNRRYETANGLAMDVQRFLQDETVQACPPSAGYRLRKFARRNKRALSAVGFVLTALVLGTLVSTWQAIRATQAEGLAQFRMEAEKNERERALEAERNAQRRLFDAKLAQAQASRWSRQVGQRFESLNTLREAAELARDLDLGEEAKRAVRDEAIACLALTDVRLVQPEWPGFPPGSPGSPGFDAHLERYARSDGNAAISVRGIADDQELARLPGLGPSRGASGMVFSPDGGLLAVRYWDQVPDSTTNLLLWDWHRGRVLFQPAFPVVSVAFSPNGQHLALAQSDGTITLHLSPGGNEVRRWSVGFGRATLAFHPDGSRLAIASIESRKVRIHDPATGKLVRELEASTNLGNVAWHPDGTLLATAAMDANVYLWDVATGHAHAVLHGHDAGVYNTAFAAGGALLISSSADGTTRLWDPWAGQELLRLPGGAQSVSRDGRRLLIWTGTRLGLWEMVLSQECRTLPRNKTGQRESIHSAGFSPDGRCLLAAADRGVWLWDTARDGEGALLPLGRTIDAQFHPGREELFTGGDAGLFRWQAQVREGVLRIGPSARCLLDGRVQRISLDQEGRHLTVVAQHRGGGGHVFDLDNPGAKVLSLPHDNTIYTATSPDGKWIATGPSHGPGVKLWEARTGKEHRHLIRDEQHATVTFSPDSRWLVTGTGAPYGVWDVGSGNPVREIQRQRCNNTGSAAFSPDGKLLAVTFDLSEVQLIDPATWRPVARLLAPEPCYLRFGPHAFSPDGSQLVVITAADNLRVWDLRRISEQLREFGLDWPISSYPPRPPAEAKPIKVEVDVREFQQHAQAKQHLERGQDHLRAKRWREAVAQFSRALELLPEHATAFHNRGHAHQELGEFDQALRDMAKAVELADSNALFANNLAWVLATCPQEEYQDAPRAVALAQRAVWLEPQKGAYWNTLGVAYYRTDDWEKARTALDRSMLNQGGNSWDWFFLAMAHWRLGEKDKARQCYEKAVAWMQKNQPQIEELRRFRAEAEELLAIKVKEN